MPKMTSFQLGYFFFMQAHNGSILKGQMKENSFVFGQLHNDKQKTSPVI